MEENLVLAAPNFHAPVSFAGKPFPNLIAAAGPDATRRFIEFFAANIRNANTRAAYPRRWMRSRPRMMAGRMMFRAMG